eukprot:TRINITY_DN15382_c0_g2_i1.p1 TRINITY_DN15382_c0_g2~~TRINITY_DN15382_c0_g2_i1.p1  ORF type:complete len:237 (+),score=22.93 TRINITY_DN15382_c0_g2_i1:76-786(+)
MGASNPYHKLPTTKAGALRDEKFSGGWFAVLSCSWGLSIILTCYVISWKEGYVPGPLGPIKNWPMISDCFVHPPASYLSRFGIIILAVCMWINAAVYFFWTGQNKNGGRQFADHVTAFLITIGCCGLATVGAVNEDENNTIHTTGAVTFFLSYYSFMTISLCRVLSMPQVHRLSRLFKIVSATIGWIAITAFVGWNIVYGKNLPVAEWTMTIMILTYELSFKWDYDGDVFIGAAEA